MCYFGFYKEKYHNLIDILSPMEFITLDVTIRWASQWFILTQNTVLTKLKWTQQDVLFFLVKAKIAHF